MEIEQGEIRLVLLGGGDSAIGIFGHRHHAVARIVLDQIFERDRQLGIVFYDKDSEHPRASPEAAEKALPCSARAMLRFNETSANAS
jgi:hypothetical protein